MADLEKLAFKRDRGYLVRLVLALAIGLVAAWALMHVLTGSEVKGCAADTLVGAKPHAADDAQ